MSVGDGGWPELACINDGGGTDSQSKRGHINFHDEYIRCDLEDHHLKKVLYITIDSYIKMAWPLYFICKYQGDLCFFFLIKRFHL